jgi:hypothetical protein
MSYCNENTNAGRLGLEQGCSRFDQRLRTAEKLKRMAVVVGKRTPSTTAVVVVAAAAAAAEVGTTPIVEV